MTIDQLPALSDPKGFDIKVPVSKNATDFAMSPRVIELDMPYNTDLVYNLADGSRFLLYTSSGNDDAKGLYIFNVAQSGGAVSHVAVRNASNITITTSVANKVTIRSTNNGSMGFLIFAGSISV